MSERLEPVVAVGRRIYAEPPRLAPTLASVDALQRRLVRTDGDLADEITNLYSNAEALRNYVVKAERRIDLLTEILVDAGLVDPPILDDLLASWPDDAEATA